MTQNQNDIITIENADIDGLGHAVEQGTADPHEAIDFVSTLLVQNQSIAQQFHDTYDFELNFLLIRESILAYHGQKIGDNNPGRYAVKLLRLAKSGKLRLIFAPQSRIASLLFESL